MTGNIFLRGTRENFSCQMTSYDNQNGSIRKGKFLLEGWSIWSYWPIWDRGQGLLTLIRGAKNACFSSPIKAPFTQDIWHCKMAFISRNVSVQVDLLKLCQRHICSKYLKEPCLLITGEKIGYGILQFFLPVSFCDFLAPSPLFCKPINGEMRLFKCHLYALGTGFRENSWWGPFSLLFQGEIQPAAGLFFFQAVSQTIWMCVTHVQKNRRPRMAPKTYDWYFCHG